MASGLLALLDDVVVLAKMAAASLDDAATQTVKASAKAAGVVVDDAAVTPRYVVGFAAERELPIVRRIAWGSLKNKLLFLLPAAMLLSAFMPWAIMPLLMIGGVFLCFEGYEKVHDILVPHHGAHDAQTPAPAADAVTLENETVAGAIRTDFILSAEIMAISLASIATQSIVMQGLVLLAVSLLVTAGVYGVVAIIVKMDDVGVYLAQRRNTTTRAIGRATVYGMPPFLKTLSLVGTVAMLWVGGGIIVHGLYSYGMDGAEHVVHAISDAARVGIPYIGAFLEWLSAALILALFGLVIGAVAAWTAVPPLAWLRQKIQLG
jgi:predicted DNA repair protein MutK